MSVGELVACIGDSGRVVFAVPSFHESGLLQVAVVFFCRVLVCEILDVAFGYVFAPSVVRVVGLVHEKGVVERITRFRFCTQYVGFTCCLQGLGGILDGFSLGGRI